MGNLDLDHGHMSTEGSLAFNSSECHAYSLRGIIVKVAPLLEMAPNWLTFLSTECSDTESEGLRRHERTGRPLGDDDFITRLESALGRSMRCQKLGPRDSMQDPEIEYGVPGLSRRTCDSRPRKSRKHLSQTAVEQL